MHAEVIGIQCTDIVTYSEIHQKEDGSIEG